MTTPIRPIIATLCTVVSLPASLLMLMGTLAMMFEDCRVGLPALACWQQHSIAAIASLAALVAWLAYFSMVSCWIGGRAESRSTLTIGTAAALGYLALTAWEFGGGDRLLTIEGGVLPALPAILLACYLVWFFGRSKLDVPTTPATD